MKIWTLDKKKWFASVTTLLANSCSGNFRREWLRYFKGFGMAMPEAGGANAITRLGKGEPWLGWMTDMVGE